MGFEDQVDRFISKYSFARSYKRGRWIRRYIDTSFDLGLNNAFALYNEFWESSLGSNQISDKLAKIMKAGKLRKYFICQVALGLVADKSATSLPSMLVPRFTGAFRSIKSLSTTLLRCKMGKCKSRTRFNCCECNKSYCEEHSTRMCQNCYEKKC